MSTEQAPTNQNLRFVQFPKNFGNVNIPSSRNGILAQRSRILVSPRGRGSESAREYASRFAAANDNAFAQDWERAKEAESRQSTELRHSRQSSEVSAGRLTGPVQYLKNLITDWQLEATDACALLGFEPAQQDDVSAIFAGRKTLSGRDAKDRIRALVVVNALLNDMYRDNVIKNEWLRETHTGLMIPPLSMILTGSMENLLVVRDFVKFSAGV